LSFLFSLLSIMTTPFLLSLVFNGLLRSSQSISLTISDYFNSTGEADDSSDELLEMFDIFYNYSSVGGLELINSKILSTSDLSRTFEDLKVL
jgi:hypothetical protein